MKKKIVVILLVLSIIALSVFSFASCTKANDDTNVIRLNEVTHSVFYAPMYVAMELGYFADEGLVIELTNGNGADNVMTAVLAGQSDIGFCGAEAAIYVNLQSSTNSPVIFGQLTNRDGSFLVGRNPEPNFEWNDLIDKEILVGRTGGVPAMCIEYVLAQHDIVDGVNVTFNYDVSFALMAAAFEGGTGDYCTMFEPVASTIEAQNKGYIVASVGAESGNLPYTCYMAKKSYLDKNAVQVEKFMRAITKGIDYVIDNDATTVAEAISGQFPTNDVALLATAVQNYKDIGAYKASPVMLEEDFEHLLDIIIGAGIITERADFDKVVDNTIANKLASEIL